MNTNDDLASARKKPRIRNKQADKAARAKLVALRAATEPPAILEKRCSRCDETKDSSNFGRLTCAPDGLNYVCKGCIRIQSAFRKEKVDENSKRWYLANKEHRLAVGRAWVDDNREKRNAQQKRYREENKDAVREGIQRCINRKPEQYREKVAEWARNNPEKRRASVARYRSKNPPDPKKVAEWNRNYRANNPEAMRVLAQVKRARKRSAEGRHSAKELVNLLSLQRYKCAACKTSIRDGYHADHIMPLAKGGSNWISNIQILCPSCNLRKHAKDPIQWAQENGRLL